MSHSYSGGRITILTFISLANHSSGVPFSLILPVTLRDFDTHFHWNNLSFLGRATKSNRGKGGEGGVPKFHSVPRFKLPLSYLLLFYFLSLPLFHIYILSLYNLMEPNGTIGITPHHSMLGYR